jgi:hypothetical protein
MVHRIERIVLFSLYVPFVSPVKGYVCTCKMMGGSGGGSVDGINERGGSAGRQGGGGGGHGYLYICREYGLRYISQI